LSEKVLFRHAWLTSIYFRHKTPVDLIIKDKNFSHKVGFVAYSSSQYFMKSGFVCSVVFSYMN